MVDVVSGRKPMINPNFRDMVSSLLEIVKWGLFF